MNQGFLRRFGTTYW